MPRLRSRRRRSETTASTDGEARKIGLLGITPDLSGSATTSCSLPKARRSRRSTGPRSGDADRRPLGRDDRRRPQRSTNSADRCASLRFRARWRRTASIKLLYFMAALSVNLGLINLLPIPVLDGGHLLLYAVEAIRGKPLNKRVIEYAFRVRHGCSCCCLMLFATWNDLDQSAGDRLLPQIRQLRTKKGRGLTWGARFAGSSRRSCSFCRYLSSSRSGRACAQERQVDPRGRHRGRAAHRAEHRALLSARAAGGRVQRRADRPIAEEPVRHRPVQPT